MSGVPVPCTKIQYPMALPGDIPKMCSEFKYQSILSPCSHLSSWAYFIMFVGHVRCC